MILPLYIAFVFEQTLHSWIKPLWMRQG